MALTPPSYIDTPHVAYARVYAGGKLITLYDDGKPSNFVSFTFGRYFDSAWAMTLNLVDPEWDRIESILSGLVGKADAIEWTFGYENEGGIKSNMTYRGILDTVQPSFIVDGIALTIVAKTDSPYGSLLAKKSKVYPNPIDQNDATDFKRISEIVEDIAKRRNWATKGHPQLGNTVEKTIELKAFDHPALSTEVNMKFFQGRMTDWEFITNQLVPRAVSEAKGLGGYVCYLETINGTTYFHFHPPVFNLKDIRIFEYMHGIQSEVLSFQVDFSGSNWTALNGSKEFSMAYTDLVTGLDHWISINNKNTPDKPLLAGYETGRLVSTPATQTTPTHSERPAANKKIAEAQATAGYFRAFYTKVKATLSIVGDDNPNIWPGAVINVLVRTPQGKVHYTSGNYIITGKEDVLQAGAWTTTLSLMREGPFGVSSAQKLEGLLIGGK